MTVHKSPQSVEDDVETPNSQADAEIPNDRATVTGAGRGTAPPAQPSPPIQGRNQSEGKKPTQPAPPAQPSPPIQGRNQSEGKKPTQPAPPAQPSPPIQGRNQGKEKKPTQPAPPAQQTTQQTAQGSLEEENTTLKAALEAAVLDAKEKHDTLLRTVADTENYKKRMQKEQQEQRKYAGRELMLDIVTTLDNLDLALHAANNAQQNNDANFAKTLLEGVEMVSKQLGSTLEKHHVVRIEAKGKPFDPSQHEAMQAVPTAECPPNQVLQEMRTGWLLHDRVLRPAMVSVAAPAQNPSNAPAHESPADSHGTAPRDG